MHRHENDDEASIEPHASLVLRLDEGNDNNANGNVERDMAAAAAATIANVDRALELVNEINDIESSLALFENQFAQVSGRSIGLYEVHKNDSIIDFGLPLRYLLTKRHTY